MKIILIRHGMTKENLEGRYVGRKTDVALCQEGVEALKKLEIKELDADSDILLFSSPMLRCQQSCQILFPQVDYTVIEDFAEIDFGEFENKNYLELNGREDYQAWIDSGGRSTYPGGESLNDFTKRCIDGFMQVLSVAREKRAENLVILAHGGTLMSIMSYLTKEDYFSFQVKNARGFYIDLKMEGQEFVDLSYHSI